MSKHQALIFRPLYCIADCDDFLVRTNILIAASAGGGGGSVEYEYDTFPKILR